MDLKSEKLLIHVLNHARVAALGTLRDGAPQVSMVPFVSAENLSEFYVHVSRLAQHTFDMQKDKRVGLLISEVDDGRADPQTLARISIRGSAEFMPAGEPGYTPVKVLYLKRFPESKPLFDLEDFGLWRIVPKGARYIAGFARAFNLTPDALQNAAAHLPLQAF